MLLPGWQTPILMPMEKNPLASTSPGNPSVTPPLERPEQGKFSIEEISFLKTHLDTYRALCHQLGEQGTRPRGTGLVKGRKKDWIISKVFPKFVEKFLSNQNGGPQLSSLQTIVLAEVAVENTSMVRKSLAPSRSRRGSKSVNQSQF